MSKDVVLVASFTHFTALKNEEYMYVKILTKELIKVSTNTSKIKNNGAHKGESGIIFRLHRLVINNKNYLFGRCIPPNLLMSIRKKTALKKWMAYQFFIAMMTNKYWKRFNRLFPILFEKTVAEAKATSIPDFNDLDFNEMEIVMDAFASNLI
jgi:hypothetical protein